MELQDISNYKVKAKDDFMIDLVKSPLVLISDDDTLSFDYSNLNLSKFRKGTKEISIKSFLSYAGIDGESNMLIETDVFEGDQFSKLNLPVTLDTELVNPTDGKADKLTVNTNIAVVAGTTEYSLVSGIQKYIKNSDDEASTMTFTFPDAIPTQEYTLQLQYRSITKVNIEELNNSDFTSTGDKIEADTPFKIILMYNVVLPNKSFTIRFDETLKKDPATNFPIPDVYDTPLDIEIKGIKLISKIETPTETSISTYDPLEFKTKLINSSTRNAWTNELQLDKSLTKKVRLIPEEKQLDKKEPLTKMEYYFQPANVLGNEVELDGIYRCFSLLATVSTSAEVGEIIKHADKYYYNKHTVASDVVTNPEHFMELSTVEEVINIIESPLVFYTIHCVAKDINQAIIKELLTDTLDYGDNYTTFDKWIRLYQYRIATNHFLDDSDIVKAIKLFENIKVIQNEF